MLKRDNSDQTGGLFAFVTSRSAGPAGNVGGFTLLLHYIADEALNNVDVCLEKQVLNIS